ncbi:MAG: hypothetical protein EOO01_00275 [Chitinophagaceae bacterium]|nr:MAG: hypothetical protein EOO01_00275 [Chitinophagaceae bacterium]
MMYDCGMTSSIFAIAIYKMPLPAGHYAKAVQEMRLLPTLVPLLSYVFYVVLYELDEYQDFEQHTRMIAGCTSPLVLGQ